MTGGKGSWDVTPLKQIHKERPGMTVDTGIVVYVYLGFLVSLSEECVEKTCDTFCELDQFEGL